MRLLKLLLCGLSLMAMRAEAQPGVVVTVVEVLEGDVVVVRSAGGQERTIRLHGIDAPEKGTALFERPREELARLVKGKEVHTERVGHDQYGRDVAYLIVGGSTNVNVFLVCSGYAHWFRRNAPNDRRLRQCEEEARHNKLGIHAGTDRSNASSSDRKRRERQVSSGGSYGETLGGILFLLFLYGLVTRRPLLPLTLSLLACEKCLALLCGLVFTSCRKLGLPKKLAALVRKAFRLPPRADRSSQQESNGTDRERNEPRTDRRSFDPHDILGVQPGVSKGELKRAYYEKMAQNHPDKVATLDPELQAFALERTKQIQMAYQALSGGY